MLRFLIQKLISKKWMVLGLLIGNIMLISVAVSYPMYKHSCFEKMLSDDFSVYLEENEEYPGIISYTFSRKKSLSSNFDQLNSLFENTADILDVPVTFSLRVLSQSESSATNTADRPDLDTFSCRDLDVQISCMSELESHITITDGEMYSENSDGDETVEAIISESAMTGLNLLVGDVIEMNNVKWGDSSTVKVKITGVFTYSDETDFYWVKSPYEYDNELFIDGGDFEQIYLQDLNQTSSTTVLSYFYSYIGYEAITVDSASDFLTRIENLQTEIKDAGGRIVTECACIEIIENFGEEKNRQQATLVILEVPIIILLLAFLFMISGQMLSMERNEISLLNSRGVRRGQIFAVYLLQAVILNVLSFFIAMPVGAFFTHVLGSASAFLEFNNRRALSIWLGWEVFAYAFAFMLISVIVMVLPVPAYSRTSIVNLKQGRMKKEHHLWRKMHLDIIILAVSIYGYYNFSSQKEQLTLKVMENTSLDPLLYFSSSLFILGCGLVLLRIWPYFMRFVFWLGKKHWKPETYASFLQIIRTGEKQIFIQEFLIITVALGIFNAAAARTILSSDEENARYQLGADVVVKQVWRDNSSSVEMGYTDTLEYYEPDTEMFLSKSLGNSTKVVDMEITVKPDDTLQTNESTSRLLGVVTNEFGPITDDPGGNPYSLADYLNVLSTNPDAVLLSASFADNYGYAVGDIITLNYNKMNMSFTVYGIFEYFPSYISETTTLMENGVTKVEDSYLIVANYSALVSKWGTLPYEIWIDTPDDTADAVEEVISEYEVEIERFDSIEQELYEIINEPMLQGTNGILTMSFMIILILWAIGFIIYWVLSIRERELFFGVLRAMGLSKKGIIKMLLNEQLMSSVLFLLSGLLVGAAASGMFVPLLQIAYTADNSIVPLEICIESADIYRLFLVIAVMFAVCMVVLIRQVFSIKITNALKLGED